MLKHPAQQVEARLKPDFVWTVHRAALGGTAYGPGEAWRIHPPAYTKPVKPNSQLGVIYSVSIFRQKG
jgi:hypothetical protein